MSLNQNTLKNNLLSIFTNMKDGDDSYFAKQVSAKIAEYVKSGSIITADTGTVPTGVFTGSGTGTMDVDPSICETIVTTACKVMSTMSTGGDAFFAAQLALGIDSMMVAGEVKTTVVGSVTLPTGTLAPLSGTAKGIFTGISVTLQSGFLAAFNAMASMSEGGDEYLAEQIATIVTAYLKAGVITTQGETVLLGSVGTGAMS